MRFLWSNWKTITKITNVSANMSTKDLTWTQFFKTNKRGQ